MRHMIVKVQTQVKAKAGVKYDESKKLGHFQNKIELDELHFSLKGEVQEQEW